MIIFHPLILISRFVIRISHVLFCQQQYQYLGTVQITSIDAVHAGSISAEEKRAKPVVRQEENDKIRCAFIFNHLKAARYRKEGRKEGNTRFENCMNV